jgi:hypothetical protein
MWLMQQVRFRRAQASYSRRPLEGVAYAKYNSAYPFACLVDLRAGSHDASQAAGWTRLMRLGEREI